MKTYTLAPNVERIQSDIEKLATFINPEKPGWTRRPFTAWYSQGREWIKNQMLSIEMEVEIDAASNLIGRITGTNPELPPIMIGSHTDTVTGGGRFDGIIGVIGGLEIARMLKETGIILNHSLEIVDFTAEEPSEFGISTIGSRGMVDNLSDEMLERRDPSGLALKEGIRMMGGHPEEISSLSRGFGDVALYLEMHIEQGPVLEQSKNKLGVVTGIVGIHRYRVLVEGKPNHAGTTPMDMRFDAFTGAAQLALELEALCKKKYKDPVVGTVGKLNVEPNASNVIPGKVIFDLEVRSLDTSILEQIIKDLKEKSISIAASRGLTVNFDCLSKSEPILVSSHIQSVLDVACNETASTLFMPSGAGHDANQLAKITQIGMIFVPSKDGRSHCPEEWTSYEDVALGVEAIARALLVFDQMDKLK
jgi:beta-ureidopropionase / N-carbamoyl-L-amino-acid hydrolase